MHKSYILILYSEYRYAAIRFGDKLEVDNWFFLLLRSSIIVSSIDIALSLVMTYGVKERPEDSRPRESRVLSIVLDYLVILYSLSKNLAPDR